MKVTSFQKKIILKYRYSKSVLKYNTHIKYIAWITTAKVVVYQSFFTFLHVTQRRLWKEPPVVHYKRLHLFIQYHTILLKARLWFVSSLQQVKGGKNNILYEKWILSDLKIFPNIKAKLSIARFQASHCSCDEEICWMNDSIIHF